MVFLLDQVIFSTPYNTEINLQFAAAGVSEWYKNILLETTKQALNYLQSSLMGNGLSGRVIWLALQGSNSIIYIIIYKICNLYTRN